jgi:hypothetical protein
MKSCGVEQAVFRLPFFFAETNDVPKSGNCHKSIDPVCSILEIE